MGIAGDVTTAEEEFCKASAIEPGCSPRNKLLKTRTGKKEFGAAAKCNTTGLVTRELLPFNPFKSSCIVMLAFSTIIFCSVPVSASEAFCSG